MQFSFEKVYKKKPFQLQVWNVTVAFEKLMNFQTTVTQISTSISIKRKK